MAEIAIRTVPTWLRVLTAAGATWLAAGLLGAADRCRRRARPGWRRSLLITCEHLRPPDASVSARL
jgi:hypothetical protein